MGKNSENNFVPSEVFLGPYRLKGVDEHAPEEHIVIGNDGQPMIPTRLYGNPSLTQEVAAIDTSTQPRAVLPQQADVFTAAA